jgi:hypothetical protein
MVSPESVHYGYAPEYADTFRRLGGAVVYRWDELPEEVQQLLLSQAQLVGNEDHPGTTKADLLTFIKKHKRKHSDFPK